MADFSSLPLKYRLPLLVYPWRRNDPVPWSPLRVPLREARLALVTTAGLYRPGLDPPFERAPGGDVSYRVLPNDTPVASLAVGQTSEEFDRAAVDADHNLAFPLDRLAELVRAREVGLAAPRHLSFNGSITAPGRLVRETAPEAADVLHQDAVDAALLVPV